MILLGHCCLSFEIEIWNMKEDYSEPFLFLCKAFRATVNCNLEESAWNVTISNMQIKWKHDIFVWTLNRVICCIEVINNHGTRKLFEVFKNWTKVLLLFMSCYGVTRDFLLSILNKIVPSDLDQPANLWYRFSVCRSHRGPNTSPSLYGKGLLPNMQMYICPPWTVCAALC